MKSVWAHINKYLPERSEACLILVTNSEGSSPGRAAFKMVVWKNGNLFGTIGGGMMEHKLVELARTRLAKGETRNFQRQQFHSKEHSQQSGMICSGSQDLAFLFINKSYQQLVAAINKAEENPKGQEISYNPSGIYFDDLCSAEKTEHTIKEGEEIWYKEVINTRRRIHIFGGGHVSLALSKLMKELDYFVTVYDDREGLNTLEENQWADQKVIVDFGMPEKWLDFDPQDTVVITTFGYRTDKQVLKAIYHLPFAYIGMLGSEKKIQQLWQELQDEGIKKEKLAHVFAPLGMPIYSKNTTEIAISIAGQIIRERNKKLSTGRSY